jgi:hypothetical protein
MKYSSNFTIYAYLPILIGTLLGAALGYFGQCAFGTCPLTSTWWRGAIYGAVLGTIFSLPEARPPTAHTLKICASMSKTIPANNDIV